MEIRRFLANFGFFKGDVEDSNVLPRDPESAFFVSAFSLLGKLAMADEVLDDRERRCVEVFIDSHLNLSEERKNEALTLFDRASTDERSAKDYACHIRSVFPNSFQIIETLLDVLMTVSLADEVLDPREEAMLLDIAEGFGLTAPQFEKVKAHHITARSLPAEDRFYEILGCSSGCLDEELLTAYRKLAQDYDPNRILATGVPSDFVLVANKKLEAIEEAFNVICSRRGIVQSADV